MLAMARDDEQRVVDADTEPDHGAEQTGDRRHVGEPGEQADAGSADQDAE